MKIKSLEYNLSDRRYVFEFEQNGLTFFRYLDRIIIEDTGMFKAWVNSLLNQAEHG